MREQRSQELWQQIGEVWHLSLPAILTQITTIAMQYIDSAMVGALGANASAAIGLVATTTWLFGGITYAIFFDVDGTLLRLGHKELSANTVAALKQFHQNGIILCMATGRGYTGVPHFDGIDFDVLLTFNGSFVTAGNDIIFKNPINEHDKYQIISNLKQMNRAVAII